MGWLGGVFVCPKYCRLALVEEDIQPQVEGPGGTAPFEGQEPCQENAKPAVDDPRWGGFSVVYGNDSMKPRAVRAALSEPPLAARVGAS